MFSAKLKIQQPFATSFFEAAISGKDSKLAHAYMLTGSDIMSQYYLAIQVAKVLNCQTKTDIEYCTCTNCSWINQNRHPAVITISPVDYTYGNTDSKNSTVISVNQVRYLRSALSSSSQYHRVIIFTDAAEGKDYEKKAEILWKEYENILTPPPKSDSSASESDRQGWMPLPINFETFNPAAPNALLKTLEEPASNITFFFLTQDKENILDTIVSRCQTVPVRAGIIQKADASVVGSIFENFPPKDYAGALISAEKLLEYSKQESVDLADLLDSLQEYFRLIIHDNLSDQSLVSKLSSYIEKTEEAKRKLSSYVSAQAVADSLFLSLVNY